MAVSAPQCSQGNGPADLEANRKACLPTIGNSYEVKRWCCACGNFFHPVTLENNSIRGRDKRPFADFPRCRLSVRYAPHLPSVRLVKVGLQEVESFGPDVLSDVAIEAGVGGPAAPGRGDAPRRIPTGDLKQDHS